MAYSLSYHTEKHSSQFSLIKVNQASDDVIVSCQESLDEKELAYQEFEVMGLFLKKHPFTFYKKGNGCCKWVFCFYIYFMGVGNRCLYLHLFFGCSKWVF